MAYSQTRISEANRSGNFIYVMMAMTLMEDYHPKHTSDRKTDLKYRREVFQYYLQKGLVIGTEHGNDWGVDLVDYTEGGLSGPNWWIPGTNTSGWNAGHLRAPVSRADFSPEYLKYGLPTQRIPFWELVYHDCVATTWYWGDSAGWFGKVAPEIKTLKDLIPSPNLEPGLVRESSCPGWGLKGFSDEKATQHRADRGPASAG